ncbi:MAG: hypothetical protein WAW03_09325, partial [Anaerolineae bacterium]
MNDRPHTIAFVDLAPRPGGSIVSLLLLAQGLAERRRLGDDPAPLYRLAVVLNAANPAVARFRDSGFFAGG